MAKSTVALAVSVIVLLASVDLAAAQQQKKKLSYDEAWKRCTAEINKANVPTDQVGARQSAGASCMKKHGHKI